MTARPQQKHGDVLRQFLDLDGARVLDVGCGDGSLVRLMARAGAQVTGLEISEENVTRARAQPPVSDETYRTGVGQVLPFEDAAFDIVVFFNSLHHVPVEHQDTALAEAARVLEPGGLLFVLEPLAEGAYFELMRPVDDETEVRAAAYGALGRAAAGPRFEEIREYGYDSVYSYGSFEELKAQVLRVDETRRAKFEALEASLREGFERTAARRDEGYCFDHPNRLNLLRRL